MKKLILTLGLFLITIQTFGQEIKYINTEQLNIRSGAGRKYEVVDKISQGQKVTVLSYQGKWSEIELENGQKGFVSTKFLSDTQNSSSQSSDKKNSWFSYLIVIGLVLYGLYKVKNFFSGLFSGNSSSSSSGSQRSTPIKREEVRRKSSNSAVYRFRIKGSGSAGGFKYADGMNVEVAVTGLGSGGSPFNNIVEKLFVQEIARKYNVEPRFHLGIKMLFNRDSLDVEIM